MSPLAPGTLSYGAEPPDEGIFGLRTDGRMIRSFWEPGPGWQAEYLLHSGTGRLKIGPLVPGPVHVFGVNEQGHPVGTWRTPAGQIVVGDLY